jgi:CRP-like cAMP-binding protein
MKVPVILEKFKDLGIKATQEIHGKTKDMLGHVVGTTGKMQGRMNVIFAQPLDFTKHYQLSHEEEKKSDAEVQFLHQALVDSDEFLFSNLHDKERSRLVAAMQLVTVQKGAVVIQQGAVGDYLYILKQGKLTFFVDGASVGSTDSPGSIFGELALLYDCPRAATVMADEECQLYRISQHNFRRIQAAHALESVDEARETLRKISMFQTLPEDLIGAIVDSLLKKEFRKGEMLAAKGDEIQGIYILKEGRIKVTDISLGSTKFADIRFGPGECFGERALVTETPGVGNVTAITDCVVWVLSKERFFRLLGHLDLKQLTIHTQNVKYLVSTSSSSSLLLLLL